MEKSKDNMRWWLCSDKKVSNKTFTILRKKEHWIHRLDCWPFFFVLYPFIFTLWGFHLKNKFVAPAGSLITDAGTNFMFTTALVFTVVSVIFHCLVHLIAYWSLSWKLLLGYVTLTSSDDHTATHLLVKPTKFERRSALCPIRRRTKGGETLSVDVEYLKKRYTLGPNRTLSPLYFPSNLPLGFYMNAAKSPKGLGPEEVSELREIYGTNNFDIVCPSFMDLFKEHAVAPFFIFQIFCVGLWLLDEYWGHSLMTLILLIFLEAQLVFKRLNEIKELREMRLNPVFVYVWRGGKWQMVSSDELLPGDIMAIPRGGVNSKRLNGSAQSDTTTDFMCPCDALLLQGTVVMNESALTGESVPQCKVPLTVDTQNKFEHLDVRSRHRQHLLSAGTTVVAAEPASDTASRVTHQPLPPNTFVCCYVLKTGFETTQGRIVRTILYASDRVTGENSESLWFLLVLLFCSLFASGYVLWQSWTQSLSPNAEHRSRYKLLLNCIMIVTSVVPPEFPITMSMAVTLSLVELFKKKIFCTEPFRLPFAGSVLSGIPQDVSPLRNPNHPGCRLFCIFQGKATICAFDKTGTLTTNRMDVRGIIGAPGCSSSDASLRQRLLHSNLHPADSSVEHVPTPTILPFCTVAAVAVCHSLAPLSGGSLAGDPVEKSALAFVGGWTMKAMDIIVSSSTNTGPNDLFTVLRRFPFASELRRMTVVVHHTGPAVRRRFYAASDATPRSTVDSADSVAHDGDAQPDSIFSGGSGVYVVSKGSPETIRSFLTVVPDEYDDLFQKLNRNGFRILALACKRLDHATPTVSSVSHLVRDELESDLHFVGFLVISCSVKPGTVASIAKLRASNHSVIMITGDHPLTAAQVALEVGMATPREMPDSGDQCLLLQAAGPKDTNTHDVTLKWSCRSNAYHVTTTTVNDIHSLAERYVLCLTGTMLDALQALGRPHYFHAVIQRTTVFSRVTPQQKETIILTLKALKEIVIMCGDGTNDVGALKNAHVGISLLSGDEPENNSQHQRKEKAASGRSSCRPCDTAVKGTTTSRLKALQSQLERAAQEDTMVLPLPKMETASIASPFTHKGTTIRCVPGIIRYGRATLATVMASYKTMAINSLITAFALSVLTLDGVKFGDFQTTVENFFVSFLVFISSKAQPARHLTKERQEEKLFSLPVLVSIFSQAALHLRCLSYGWQLACALRPVDYVRDVDGDFSPNLTNTVVFLTLSAMHGATFLANYNGPPCMIPLRENRLLWKGLIIFYVALSALALEIMPSLNELFSLVPLPSWKFKFQLLALLLIDVLGSWWIGKLCSNWEIRASTTSFHQRRHSSILL